MVHYVLSYPVISRYQVKVNTSTVSFKQLLVSSSLFCVTCLLLDWWQGDIVVSMHVVEMMANLELGTPFQHCSALSGDLELL